MKKLQTAELKEIIGQENAKKQLLGILLSEHHALVIGPPGVGKTTLAKNVAEYMPEGKFVRVQGSPDLTVEDLLGDIDPIKALKFGPTSKEAFTPGKIFKADKGVLFFDEINRAPEKLQNALLQALQERRVTLGSYDVDFDINFLFIATMNPEDTNTERLSEVLLDRFDVVYVGYPETIALEKQIVKEKGKNLLEVPEKLHGFMINFVRLLRKDEDLKKVPSVRASINWYERAQQHAILGKKQKVSIKDVSEVMLSVLAHRIELKPSLKYNSTTEQFLKEKFGHYTASEKEGGVP